MAEVARHHVANADMIFKWLRDPRFADGCEEMAFLPVEMRVTADAPAIDALSDDAADTASFERYRRLAEHRSARLASVVLDIAPEENAWRLVPLGHNGALKLTRTDVLKALRSRYRLLRPSGIEMIDLDITKLSAADAAGEIIDLLGRPGTDAGTGVHHECAGQR